MSAVAAPPRRAPDAVFCLDATLYFFRGRKFACWDVVGEAMLPGYPRDVASAFPGLLDAFPGAELRGALHVPEWGARVYFLFEGRREAIAWNLDAGTVEGRVAVAELLPGELTREDFTPAYSQLADGTRVIYAFRGYDYTRFTVSGSAPLREDPGFPRRIDADWKDGLVLAPRSAVYVEWPSRSSAHSNRKLYFFMGNLYLRWDVPSNTRNYRLDIVSGWKGWPDFA